MVEKAIVDLLEEHAEALGAGADIGEALLAAHPRRRGALAGLFDLAEHVRDTLATVEPPPEFVADLKRRLIADAQHAWAITRREHRRRTLALAAGVGGAVYLLGVAAVGARVGLSLAGLALTIVGWRRRSGARSRMAGQA